VLPARIAVAASCTEEAFVPALQVPNCLRCYKDSACAGLAVAGLGSASFAQIELLARSTLLTSAVTCRSHIRWLMLRHVRSATLCKDPGNMCMQQSPPCLSALPCTVPATSLLADIRRCQINYMLNAAYICCDLPQAHTLAYVQTCKVGYTVQFRMCAPHSPPCLSALPCTVQAASLLA
jgi:hypothetical protein